jgi:hypothetical protein
MLNIDDELAASIDPYTPEEVSAIFSEAWRNRPPTSVDGVIITPSTCPRDGAMIRVRITPATRGGVIVYKFTGLCPACGRRARRPER